MKEDYMLETFPKSWQDYCQQLHFEQVTPIQEASFSPISSGKSVLITSPTGTGKTLAYLFPSLLKLVPKKSQQLLILAPNTELAGQIFDVTKVWAEKLGLDSQLLISGSSQKRQIERLKKGPEILIGTPGRIYELVKLKKIKLMNVETMILDEFDLLLKDSQYDFVKRLTNHVPRDHQMIYISATNSIDSKYLVANTLVIDLNTTSLETISHYYVMLEKRQRLELLRKIGNIEDTHALVFFNALADLGAAEERLQYNNILAVSLASDVSTGLRKTILRKFKNREIQLLLATDMISRGIDIEQLELVINYDLPKNQEDYIHRAGRTGRMGYPGAVVTLLSHPQELKILKKWADVHEVVLKNQEWHVKS